MGDLYLQPGDIVLRKGTGWISQGIELITHSQFSHAALVSNPETKQIIEATFDGVIKSNIDDYTGYASVFRLKTITNEQAANIVKYAEQQLGKPYDFEELIDQFLRYVFYIPNNEIEKGRFICSTFVNAAYASQGIKLTNQNLPSPEDIYESPLLTKVAEIYK
ncbi:YiiX/YebB-like N1pC/P60 family cysteine hydrolase [Ectobacillus panaciterrae]|uniref:YiiX/YebB-like N1pC/P60 family cysteine hydrolase n=1 Tax=Ectobacillus panaciterrae TaxID=363872 RepID=UPI00040DF92B|nr:YiiX/YebB-like N1pC/P60 family cysteine hydrolase [Ectobacillus panaciterrae]